MCMRRNLFYRHQLLFHIILLQMAKFRWRLRRYCIHSNSDICSVISPFPNKKIDTCGWMNKQSENKFKEFLVHKFTIWHQSYWAHLFEPYVQRVYSNSINFNHCTTDTRSNHYLLYPCCYSDAIRHHITPHVRAMKREMNNAPKAMEICRGGQNHCTHIHTPVRYL